MKVYFDTLGCPKNISDSEMAMSFLKESGHISTSNPEDADVIIVNTCGFIEDAKKESIEEIFEMAKYKKNNKKLIVSGCLVQRYSKELYEEIPEADGFIGVNDYERLPELLDKLEENEKRFLVANKWTPEEIEKSKKATFSDSNYVAYLKIGEGCDNACTYCVIPQIRGPYRSRKEELILEEAKNLANNGCKELILIAQDLTYYGTDLYGETRLPELLEKLCKVEGIKWIRLLYCYEDNITDKLIDVISKEKKICKYIDIPIQHASDKILYNMNRPSTKKSLEDTLKRLKEKIPDIHIRTTLIVGFPGETEEDFEILYDFVEEQRFQRLGVFPYSREEGTLAGEMENQTPEEIKKQRLDSIMLAQMGISLEHNKEKIGKIFDVIIDGNEEKGVYFGRTEFDSPDIDNGVIFSSEKEHKPGDIVKVRITDAYDYDLQGTEVY